MTTTTHEQTPQAGAADTTTRPTPPRTRRGRGRRRLGSSLRPVRPMRAHWEAASEEERRQGHARAAIILEYWTGVKTKQEAAQALDVPPIRIWQMSQRAATGVVCALLSPPSGRRGRPMARPTREAELEKEIARLQRENALQKELIAVLRDLPGNREREIVPATKEEAGAAKPRRKKSREPRAQPGAAGVDPTPAPPAG